VEYSIDGGMIPASGGYIEARSWDGLWGTSASANLIGQYTTRFFTVPRSSRRQSLYLKYVDPSGKVSRYPSWIQINYPLIPDAPSATVQSNITDDSWLNPKITLHLPSDPTDVFGVEIRAADNTTVLYKYSDLALSLSPDDAALTWEYQNASLDYTAVLYAYFFNTLGEYSSGTTINLQLDPNAPLSVKAFGAKGDGKAIFDGHSVAGSALFTSDSAVFTADMVGQPIYIFSAGAADGGDLSTTVSAYISPSAVTLADNASTTFGSCVAYWGGTDDTVAIQAAIDATNTQIAEVYFPPGTYMRSAALTYKSTLRRMFGAGRRASVICAVAPSATSKALNFVDVDQFKLERQTFVGPGMDAVDGGKLAFRLLDRDNTHGLVLDDIEVIGVADDGISIYTPILSTLRNLRITRCAENGLHLEGGGTSTELVNVYSLTHGKSAIRLTEMVYCGLKGCAAEVAGIGYEIKDCSSVRLDNCGAEVQLERTPPAPTATVNPSAIAGGSVTVGPYYFKYSWVKGWSSSSPASPESAQFTVTSGNQIIGGQLPASPAGVTRAWLYFTAPSGASGSEGYVKEITVSPTGATDWTKTTAFTPGSAPASYGYPGIGYKVDGGHDISVAECYSRSVPSALTSRHLLVTGTAKRVKFTHFSAVEGDETPPYVAEIASGCEDIIIESPNFAASALLNNSTVRSGITAGLATDWSGNLLLKNKTEAYGITSDPTTTSSTPVDLADMSITITTYGNKVLVIFHTISRTDTGGEVVMFKIIRDAGTAESKWAMITPSAGAHNFSSSISWIDNPAVGVHTYKVQWWVTAGSTGTAYGTSRAMQAVELG